MSDYLNERHNITGLLKGFDRDERVTAPYQYHFTFLIDVTDNKPYHLLSSKIYKQYIWSCISQTFLRECNRLVSEIPLKRAQR